MSTTDDERALRDALETAQARVKELELEHVDVKRLAEALQAMRSQLVSAELERDRLRAELLEQRGIDLRPELERLETEVRGLRGELADAHKERDGLAWLLSDLQRRGGV